jgi:hypothetical protein
MVEVVKTIGLSFTLLPKVYGFNILEALCDDVASEGTKKNIL